MHGPRAAQRRSWHVLETDGRIVCLTVADNGVGIPPEGRPSGLANMAERARTSGGDMHPEGGGTVLVWRVPVTGAQDPAAR